MSATNACQTHRETIVALRGGRFDAIAPDRMDAAELHLNGCEACQRMLAGVTPGHDPLVAAAGEASEPPQAVWEAMWRRIDSAKAPASATFDAAGAAARRVDQPIFGGERRETAAAAPPRLLRLVRSTGILAAAAMVLLMVGLWQAVPARASEWEFDLAGADDVEIESMQVYDDNGVPLVLSTGGEEGVSVIWVVGEGNGGA